ncbi:MAG: hypothetical protein LUG64_06180 [Clostridiales bacterium]|nr:hypothetical protein [Clostridiales bacterium]
MYENAIFNERYTISAILYDEKGRFWPEIRETISEDDFISKDCKALFRAACELLDAGKVVNAATVRAKAGVDLETVKELVNLAPTAANIRSYAELVRKESLRRKAREIGEELTETAGEESTDPLQMLTETARRLDDLTAEKRSGTLLSGAELTCDFLSEVEAAQKQGAAFRTFPMLDRFTGGFQPGRMYIFAARPGVGKSALGVALAQMLAKKRRVLYVSAEMSPDEIMARIISSRTAIPYSVIKGGGELTAEQWGDIAAATNSVDLCKRREATTQEAETHQNRGDAVILSQLPPPVKKGFAMFAFEIVGACSFVEQDYQAEARVIRVNRDTLAEWKTTEKNLTRRDFDTPEQYDTYCQTQGMKRLQFMKKVFSMFGVDLDASDVDGTVSHVLDDVFTVLMMKELPA